MKRKFKVGDIVRIKPEYCEDPVREIIHIDETDDETPYQLDGDDDFRLKWWGDDMLEKNEPKFELTADEANRFARLLNSDYYQCRDLLIKNCDILEESDKTRLRDEMKKDAEILNRIYKWQGKI